METVVIRKAIINTLAAAGGNVANVSASGAYPGACIVCTNNALATLVEYLPPITKGTCVRATKEASQTEQVQISVLGMANEVIVSSTRYKIEIGCPKDKYMSQHKEPSVYAYTSPAVLSGTPATDRLNVYTVMAAKINNDPYNNCTAYLMYSVAFTGGATALPVIGETVTQATSLATAKVAAVEVTSGNFTATTAAGTIWLYDVAGTWDSASRTLTGTSTAVVTTAAALVQTGMVIVDSAGYYAASPSQRKGANSVQITAGFTTAKVDVGQRTSDTTLLIAATGILRGRKARYSNGIGSEMLARVPAYHADKLDYVSGDAELILNAAPDATKTYTEFRIVVNGRPIEEVLTGYEKVGEYVYILYADESSGANLTNLETGLEAALGVTIA
jgi:hypothetical protein